MKLILAALLAGACASACSGKREPTVGTGTGTAQSTAPCEGIRGKVEQLYRVEAQAKEPKRVEEAVADNTTMVMNDCAKAPDKVAACVRGATTIADLEQQCLVQLDDEGSEGAELHR